MQAGAQREQRDLVIGISVLYVVANFFSSTVGVLLHYDWGVRALSLTGFYLVTLCFMGIVLGLFATGSFMLSPLAVILMIASIGAGLYHQVQIVRNRRQGKRIHSYDTGHSILYTPFDRILGWVNAPFRVREYDFQRWWEPLGLIFVLGLPICAFDLITGGYLIAAGGCLLVRNQIEHQYWFNQVLDMIDAEIEMEALELMVAQYTNPGTGMDSAKRPPFAEAVASGFPGGQQSGIARRLLSQLRHFFGGDDNGAGSDQLPLPWPDPSGESGAAAPGPVESR